MYECSKEGNSRACFKCVQEGHMAHDCPNPGSGSRRGHGRSDIGVVVTLSRTGIAAVVNIKTGIGAGDETAIYSSNSRSFDDWSGE